jgi:hypothetical protein
MEARGRCAPLKANEVVFMPQGGSTRRSQDSDWSPGLQLHMNVPLEKQFGGQLRLIVEFEGMDWST